ncbi:hypothetical protein [Streptomyces sp. MST-110588]|uniref:hypothetical protein n=1 Tax=Streptomyces sp. MST-110588 TaxID=2833628 RepID=UPI001F5D0769|nr:hypothetical protein [Streptomyces sp. MST-110588]UNO41884.1 hypothetical protein KGS77_23010 [Streptomyces sp. MST-110588]
MTTTPTSAEAGTAWLVQCSVQPATVRALWKTSTLAPLRSDVWRVVEADLLRSVDAMRPLGRAGALGPVLVSTERRRAWWLTALDAEDHLDDIPALTVRPARWPLLCPEVGHSAYGRAWLEAPDGTGKLTEPIALGAAFGPGSTLSAEAFR